METRNESVRILARSLRKQLTDQGYAHHHLVALATALLDEVTTELAAAARTAAQEAPQREERQSAA